MKHLKKLIISLLIALSLTFPVSEVLPSMGTVVTVEAASKVKLNKKKATLIKGQTLKLKLSGTKSKVKWSSSKSSIASVNSSGKVTAKKKGSATITAKVEKKTYTCKITVQSPSISAKSISLKVGESTKLKLNGTDQKVKWSSSKKSIASVNSSGKITAKKAGTATITATVLNKKYSCKVTVKKISNSAGEGTYDSPFKLSYGKTFSYTDYNSNIYKVSLKLLETIDGEDANQIVKEENMFNEEPDSTNRWVLYHYKLKYISGSEEISASDILNTYYLYNSDATINIGASCEIAAFAHELKGLGIYDVRLYPGGSSDVWLGILLDNDIKNTTLKFKWYDKSFDSHELWFSNQ